MPAFNRGEGNDNDSFAAFTLQLKPSPAHLRDQLATLASCFGDDGALSAFRTR
jgi:hypothetical protein